MGKYTLEHRYVVTALDAKQGNKHVANWLVIASGYQACVSMGAFHSRERVDKDNYIFYIPKIERDWYEDLKFYERLAGKFPGEKLHLDFPSETFDTPYAFYEHIGYDRKKRKFTGEKKWKLE